MDGNDYKKYEPVFGEWHIVRLIGVGGFSKVYEIEKKSSGITRKAALKAVTIPQDPGEVQEALINGMNEAQVRHYFEGMVRELMEKTALANKLQGSENIVGCENFQVIEHREGIGWDILIQMELLTPLDEYIRQQGSLSRTEIIRLGTDLCKALELCRKHHIVHRDIKPGNIFRSEDGTFKLGDFGTAWITDGATDQSFVRGTYAYMAPELYKGEAFDSKTDLYSLGLVLYQLLNNNRLPFQPAAPAPMTYADRQNAWKRRLLGEPLPLPVHGEGRLGEIVRKACAYAPGDRYEDPARMGRELEDGDIHSTSRPPQIPSIRGWPEEWNIGEICSFHLYQDGTHFSCDGSTVIMKRNLGQNGRRFDPMEMSMTTAQREALWKKLECMEREDWGMPGERLDVFDYEWEQYFQCELTGGRRFQYCSDREVPPGFTVLYEFLWGLFYPEGRCAQDRHFFVPVIKAGGWRGIPQECLCCRDCGLEIPIWSAESYPESRISGIVYTWPTTWQAEDIVCFSVSFGDCPIRSFTWDGRNLTARNEIDVGRDGGKTFPPGYFQPVSFCLSDEQKEKLYRCLEAIPKERWSSDITALEYEIRCPTGYTRHSFFSCEGKNKETFEYLPGKEAAPGFIRLCSCLEEMLPREEKKSEAGFWKRFFKRSI